MNGMNGVRNNGAQRKPGQAQKNIVYFMIHLQKKILNYLSRN